MNIKKLQKILKILILNIIIIVLLVEITSFIFLLFKFKDTLISFFHSNSTIEFINRLYKSERYNEFLQRQPLVKNPDNSQIIIFGCSFAQGSGLTDEEAISGQIFKKANITVHNRGIGGSGPQMMLWQLQQPDFKNQINNAKTIIYVYAVDPPPRSCKFRCHPFTHNLYYRYKYNKDGSFILQKPNFFNMHSYFFRAIEGNNEPFFNKDNHEKIFTKIIEESYKKSKELYPNSEFVLLYYNTKNIYPLGNDVTSRLKEIGIKIIDTNDLIKEDLDSIEYQISEFDSHPNAKAWELIVPELLKRISI